MKRPSFAEVYHELMSIKNNDLGVPNPAMSQYMSGTDLLSFAAESTNETSETHYTVVLPRP